MGIMGYFDLLLLKINILCLDIDCDLWRNYMGSLPAERRKTVFYSANSGKNSVSPDFPGLIADIK